jgi:hypothetical protein
MCDCILEPQSILPLYHSTLLHNTNTQRIPAHPHTTPVKHLLRRGAVAEHHGRHAHFAVAVGHADAVDGHIAEPRHPAQRVGDLRGGHVLRGVRGIILSECECGKVAQERLTPTIARTALQQIKAQCCSALVTTFNTVHNSTRQATEAPNRE